MCSLPGDRPDEITIMNDTVIPTSSYLQLTA
jgi:hypothetical protein